MRYLIILRLIYCMYGFRMEQDLLNKIPLLVCGQKLARAHERSTAPKITGDATLIKLQTQKWATLCRWPFFWMGVCGAGLPAMCYSRRRFQESSAGFFSCTAAPCRTTSQGWRAWVHIIRDVYLTTSKAISKTVPALERRELCECPDNPLCAGLAIQRVDRGVALRICALK
jgi:hypothetical protein